MIKETKADSRLIRWLLSDASGVSRYRIAKDLGISEATLSRMARDETPIESLRFGSAHKLTEYARKLQATQARQVKGATSHDEKTDK